MQILFNYPHVINKNFRSKYNGIKWINNQESFIKWCRGETGYPMVDAGMRQLNKTGYMHNRARMITAGFLCKHLLIDWRWGEAYFAKKLLDPAIAIVVTPGSLISDECEGGINPGSGYVRFALMPTMEEMHEAAEKLKKLNL